MMRRTFLLSPTGLGVDVIDWSSCLADHIMKDISIVLQDELP